MNITRWLKLFPILGRYRQTCFVPMMASARRSRRSSRLRCEMLESRIVPQASASELYVTQLYTDLLHRTVDSEGLAGWSALIDSGESHNQVAQDIEMSVEYRNDVVQQIYDKDLHRSAEPAELASWSALLQSESIEQVQADIIGSAEYYQRAGGTNEGFAAALYQDVLNHAIDPTSTSAIVEQLNNGASPEIVAFQVLSSTEYRTDLVQSYYSQFLHRSADAAGLTSWVNQGLAQGMSDQVVIAGVVSSPEYLSLTPSVPAAPKVTSPGSAVTSKATTFAITGTADNGSLVKVLRGSSVVGSEQLVGTQTDFSITVPLTSNTVNSFDVTATNASGKVSVPATVPPITQHSSSVTVTAPAKQTNHEGDSVNLPVSASDTSGQTLSYSATGLPSGLSISATTGTITGTIASGAATSSPYTVKVTATDGTSNDSATFTWLVSSPVTVTAPAAQTNHEGDSVNLPVSASDTSGQTLSYSATGLPSGLSISATTGTITGTVASGAAASSPFTVTVTATDGTSSGSATFTWLVSNAPIVTAPATQLNVNGDNVASVAVTASGTGTSPITYTATGLPSGLTINSATGIISGTIAQIASNNSPYAVTVSATQNSATGTASFSWVVTTSSTTTLPFSLTSPAWVTLPSGVRIQDLTVGTGTAVKAGDSINVNYDGFLTDGTDFNSGNNFTATLDTSNLIAGWVDGVPGMKPGGVRLLDIPSSLAYGATPPSGSGIPANAELVFKITLNS